MSGQSDLVKDLCIEVLYIMIALMFVYNFADHMGFDTPAKPTPFKIFTLTLSLLNFAFIFVILKCW